MKRPSVWTDERNKLMQVSSSRVPDFEVLLRRLNALPGVPISTAAAVRTRWYMMLKTGPKRGDWTPERMALLKVCKADGLSLAEILERVNQLEGYPIRSTNAIDSKLQRMREQANSPCDRVSRSRAIAEPSHPAEPPPDAAFCDEVPTGFIVVSYDDAKRWARRAGLLGKYSALNLKKANAARHASGLPLFALKGAM